jgi:Tol biopolymer transport system component
MPLAPGTRLGPYQIESSIGAGGMGEVYKGRDTRLNRIVAIKVLSAALATDREFRERFDREAKSISSLNHPNICILYDVGHDQGNEFLVLEFLEGETLAARIAKGPLPLAEALKIAVEISSALDKAHRQGIVHRDLKPGNVMLTKAGAKLLDFGLATNNAALAGVPASELPTGVAPLTAQGTILGTFQYMAPEQIEGEPADPRTDIFAFGAVLYEAITGRKAFTGKSQVSLLGTILMTPPALGRVIRTCLRKDRDDRFQSVHDLWLQLQWVEEGGSAAGLPAPVVVHRKRRERSLWIAAALALAAVTGATIWWLKPAPLVTHVVTRFQYPLPEGQTFTRTGRHDLALSPDGARLAYVANQQLYLRAMDQLEAQPVRGTNEDPMEPVFSPDGQWLAYFTPVGGAGGSPNSSAWVLKKIAVAGGAPVTLGTLAAAPWGATWRNGTIAFGMNAGSVAGVQTVPDSGGTPQTILTVDPKKERAMQPQLLVDGKHLLFVAVPLVNTVTEGQIVVQALDGKDRRTLVNGGSDPRVLPAGQLVYIHDGTLLAVPFDIRHLTVTGGPVPIVEGVAETPSTWAGQFAISAEGALALIPGGVAGDRRVLVWVDREGHEQPISANPRVYLFPRLSPDGTKIAVSSDDEEHDIWVFDLAKETLTRLTFGPAYEQIVAWAPDGKYLFFSSGLSAATLGAAVPVDIFRKAADGTGATEPLTQRLEGGFPLSLAPDEKSLVFRVSTLRRGLFLLPLEPKGEAHPLIADPKFNVLNGEISPDGRWIAYDSNESGRYEVYVRPFPAVDSGRWQISSEGGSEPAWARSGRELFFLNAANRMTAVSVPAGASFTYGKPEPLFSVSPYYGTGAGRTFDISTDGKRFLMVKAVGSVAGGRPSIVVVSHWFDEVKAHMPGQ